MRNPVSNFWTSRLERCRQALEKNNFQAFVAGDAAQAKAIFHSQVLPGLEVKTVSWGDSMTLHATGILDHFRQNPDFDLIETFENRVPREKIIEKRRRALLAELERHASTESATRLSSLVPGKETMLTLGLTKRLRYVEFVFRSTESHFPSVSIPLHATVREGVAVDLIARPLKEEPTVNLTARTMVATIIRPVVEVPTDVEGEQVKAQCPEVAVQRFRKTVRVPIGRSAVLPVFDSRSLVTFLLVTLSEGKTADLLP